MLLKLTAIALLPAATLAADPTSALDCHQVYLTATSEILSVEKQCEALVEFSKCLSAFPESGLMESELFKRNSKACEPFWKAAGEPTIRTKRGNFQLTVDDAKQVNFYRHRREEINVFDMNAQIVELQQMVTTLKSELTQNMTNVQDSVQVKIDDLKQEQKDKEAAMTEAMDGLKDSVQNTIEKSIDGVKDDVATTTQGLISQVNNVKTLVSDSVSKLTSDTNKALQAQSASVLSKVDTKVKSLNSTVTAVSAIAKAAKIGNVETPKHMWSGGARAHNRGSSWQDFVLDRIEIDTAAPYFKKNSNTRFKALKTGLFRIRYHVNQHANSWCWRHAQIMIDGKNINYEHKYAQSWASVDQDITWWIKAGQEFWARIYLSNCGGNYVWHGASNWQNAYNRVQVEYVGNPEGKCTSNQGLC